MSAMQDDFDEIENLGWQFSNPRLWSFGKIEKCVVSFGIVL